MKHLLLSVLTLCLAMAAEAQLTPEKTYDGTVHPRIYEDGVAEFVVVDAKGNKIITYNDMHVVVDEVDYDFKNPNSATLLQVTKLYFDKDEEREYLIRVSSDDEDYDVIIDDDGSVIHRFEGNGIIHLYRSAGTPLLSWVLRSGKSTEVYRLEGKVVKVGAPERPQEPVASAWPNPAQHVLNISYELPAGSGTLRITDSQGRVLDQRGLASGTSQVQYSTFGMQPGQYWYQVLSNGKAGQAKSFSVVR